MIFFKGWIYRVPSFGELLLLSFACSMGLCYPCPFLVAINLLPYEKKKRMQLRKPCVLHNLDVYYTLHTFICHHKNLELTPLIDSKLATNAANFQNKISPEKFATDNHKLRDQPQNLLTPLLSTAHTLVTTLQMYKTNTTKVTKLTNSTNRTQQGYHSFLVPS